MDERGGAIFGGGGIEMIGGFESTYLPVHDTDIFETTGHDRRWREDLALLAATGVTRLRYPIRWHRVEQIEGMFDWTDTDRVLLGLREEGLTPIVDLVHHTSYPRWLTGGFADPRFGPVYLRYVSAFARRYPWVEQFTLFNEPFATLFLCGHEAVWPPYWAGLDSFVTLLANTLPAISEASRMLARLLPGAKHVWIDSCENHSGTDRAGQDYADMANERRFLVLDLFLGRGLPETGPLAAPLRLAGGDRLRDLEPGRIDVLGLDYYAHCQWEFSIDGGTAPAAAPLPLADQILQYSDRYDYPLLLTETNLRGTSSDRATWFKYVLEQCEIARDRGVPLEGFCWFPFVDSADWDSLLARSDGNIDPVGVYWLDDSLDRRESVMADVYRLAVAGAGSSALPAFPLLEPVATSLRGYLPQMAHWTWQPKPTGPEQVLPVPAHPLTGHRQHLEHLAPRPYIRRPT